VSDESSAAKCGLSGAGPASIKNNTVHNTRMTESRGRKGAANFRASKLNLTSYHGLQSRILRRLKTTNTRWLRVAVVVKLRQS
jgi:hypothetical protein